jgi:hypothetical protein
VDTTNVIADGGINIPAGLGAVQGGKLNIFF